MYCMRAFVCDEASISGNTSILELTSGELGISIGD